MKQDIEGLSLAWSHIDQAVGAMEKLALPGWEETKQQIESNLKAQRVVVWGLIDRFVDMDNGRPGYWPDKST